MHYLPSYKQNTARCRIQGDISEGGWEIINNLIGGSRGCKVNHGDSCKVNHGDS